MPLPPITSRQNPRVKQACALRSRGERDRTGQSIVYGVRETARALAAGASVVSTFLCREVFRTPEAEELVASLDSADVELLEVTKPVFEKIAYGDRLDGVISVVAARALSLADLGLPENPLVVVVDRVEKPGNLGAILRSSDGAGVDAVVVVDPVIDLFNPNTIRASIATVFKSNVALAAASETIAWLAEHGIQPWTARPDATECYYEANFREPSAIVLGCEAVGLGPEWNLPTMRPINLPMQGIADSLNVSTAGAILTYEARRQRDSK